MTLRKGVQLSTLTELHSEQTVVSNVLDNMLCDDMESTDTNLLPKNKELIDNYQSKLNNIPESQRANVPIEHRASSYLMSLLCTSHLVELPTVKENKFQRQ